MMCSSLKVLFFINCHAFTLFIFNIKLNSIYIQKSRQGLTTEFCQSSIQFGNNIYTFPINIELSAW